MKKLALPIVSIVLGWIISSQVNQFILESSGITTAFGRLSVLGFPFHQYVLPCEGCFSPIRTNPTGSLLNIFAFSVVIYCVLIVLITGYRRLRQP